MTIKQRALWLHTGILAIAFVMTMSRQSGSASPTRPATPAGFEYKIVQVLNGDPALGGAFLKQFDAQGWELVTVQPLITQSRSDVGGIPMKNLTPFKIVDKHYDASALYIFRRPRATGN